jgi:hypothetical protein
MLNGLPVTEEQVDAFNFKAPVLGSEMGVFLFVLLPIRAKPEGSGDAKLRVRNERIAGLPRERDY